MDAVIVMIAADPERTALYVIAACYALAHVAALTPWAWDKGVMKVVMRAIDLVAANYAFARNARDRVKDFDEALSGG
jgi:hypothetical protein